MYWNHRIVRSSIDEDDGTDYFTFAEVYYDDDGQPIGWAPHSTDDLEIEAMHDLVNGGLAKAWELPILFHPDDFPEGRAA